LYIGSEKTIKIHIFISKFSIMSLLHEIALTLVPGVGSKLAKNLVSYCGGAEAVFKASKEDLARVPGIGKQLIQAISTKGIFERAEEEVSFVERHKIQALFYTNKLYPERLKMCLDSPAMIYYKGNGDLNHHRILSVVGTRKITNYGREIVQKVISDLSKHDVLISSGMAYGVDTAAHRVALDNGLQTVGVFAHGLDRVYPSVNERMAREMISQGGLLTEFVSGTNPDKENFPQRNRIVAGMADATLVIESGERGGALITAEIANSYNRDVFAIPGRVGDKFSLGTNRLIHINKAAMVQSAEDILYLMNWKEQAKSGIPKQTRLLLDLSPDEELIIEILKEKELMEIDHIKDKSGIKASQLASILLNLEFQNVIRCLPGKIYKLNRV
jgi:DNA processing protein